METTRDDPISRQEPTAMGAPSAPMESSSPMEATSDRKGMLDEVRAVRNYLPNTPNTCLLYTSPSPRD